MDVLLMFPSSVILQRAFLGNIIVL
jgi:hypothetical protein